MGKESLLAAFACISTRLVRKPREQTIQASELMPRYTPLVQSLPSSVPFVGPEASERMNGFRFHARLGANENVFGPSPKAIEAMQKAAAEEAAASP